ncbi:MAG: hypothetical protein QOE77_40 [Blastocatellia bacterium]|jgi:hypothetical protein|nr:hypothetical protein [Blastocatellia bacterium]
MPQADMSPAAITTRLRRVSQLRRLGLSLRKAKPKTESDRVEGRRMDGRPPAKQNQSSK